MNNTRIREIVGTRITFDDGRKGIISGGSLTYGWARTLDDSVTHQYTWETLARKIANGSQFPVIP